MQTDLQRIVGQRVALRRHHARLTQAELATRAHLSETTLSRVEHGHQSLSMETLLALAQVLDCSSDYLLGRVEDPERDSPRPQTRRRPHATARATV